LRTVSRKVISAGHEVVQRVTQRSLIMRCIDLIVCSVLAIGSPLLGFSISGHAAVQDPFGGDSVLLRTDENGVASLWHDELARIAFDRERVETCSEVDSPDCLAAQKLLAIVEEANGYAGRAKLGHINRAINLLLRPMPGAWLSPLDVLRVGAGDCKDYSLAKYFALRQAGVAPDRLRLVIVHNKRRAQDHMVVAALQGSGWLILDNQTMAIVPDGEASSIYRPLFVLDDTGARQYRN
jgi:predicted transglutaminase-like cysteine proteinase